MLTFSCMGCERMTVCSVLNSQVLPPGLDDHIAEVVDSCRSVLENRLVAVILYGSQARGQTNDQSDMDVYVITLVDIDQHLKTEWEIAKQLGARDVFTDLHIASKSNFLAEISPFHTAAKRDGIVVWGEIDLAESSRPYHVRYEGFFRRSRVWERSKINHWANFEEDDLGCCAELFLETCLVASKHAVQCCLQMRGEGFTSKYAPLIAAAKKYRPEIAGKLDTLRRMDVPGGKAQAEEIIRLASEILKLYDVVADEFSIH